MSVSRDIAKAVTHLRNNDLVAIPTETVYGLAGRIYSEKAIKAIFHTKKRPFFNPLIVHIYTAEKLTEIVSHIPEKAQLLANQFWPGPMTLVLPKHPDIPEIITAGKPTVAVRIPNHPVALELLQQLNEPLAAPSANPFGSISPTTAAHVEAYFKDAIKMVLDGGACKNGIESTIIGFEDEEPVVLRLGSIPVEAIEAVVGSITVKNKKSKAPEAPGMLDRHYAPKTKTILTTTIAESIKKYEGQKVGVLVFHQKVEHQNVAYQVVLSKTKDFEEAASNLYNALHLLDQQNLDIIITEQFPDHNLGKSINDRLMRATK